jgi:hypothetical protein
MLCDMKINEGTLGNIPEQRKHQLYRCGRLKFPKANFFRRSTANGNGIRQYNSGGHGGNQR